MSIEVNDTTLDAGQRNRLTNRIHDIAPLLEVDSPFTVRDVDADDARSAVLLLKRNGALVNLGKTRVRREYPNRDAEKVDFINEWEWVSDAKSWLRGYLNDIDTLPCGHRFHICNPPEVDGYSCRECIDDGEFPEYSRELLEKIQP